MVLKRGSRKPKRAARDCTHRPLRVAVWTVTNRVKPHHPCRCTGSWLRTPGRRRGPLGRQASTWISSCIWVYPRAATEFGCPQSPLRLGLRARACGGATRLGRPSRPPSLRAPTLTRGPDPATLLRPRAPAAPSVARDPAHTRLPSPQPGRRLSPRRGTGATPSPPLSLPSSPPARTYQNAAAQPRRPARTTRGRIVAPAYTPLFFRPRPARMTLRQQRWSKPRPRGLRC